MPGKVVVGISSISPSSVAKNSYAKNFGHFKSRRLPTKIRYSTHRAFVIYHSWTIPEKICSFALVINQIYMGTSKQNLPIYSERAFVIKSELGAPDQNMLIFSDSNGN